MKFTSSYKKKISRLRTARKKRLAMDGNKKDHPTDPPTTRANKTPASLILERAKNVSGLKDSTKSGDGHDGIELIKQEDLAATLKLEEREFRREIKNDIEKYNTQDGQTNKLTITPATAVLFIHAYAKNNTNLTKACRMIGISKGSISRLEQASSHFSQWKQNMEDMFLDNIEELMITHAHLPNSVIERIFLLKTRRKAKYGDVPQLATAVQVNVEYPNFNKLRSPDEATDGKQVNASAGVRSSAPAITVP